MRRDIGDPQHRIEDNPGSGSPEGAAEALGVPQKLDRRKSRLERAPRSRARFGDDSEEGGFAALDQALVGGQSLQRGLGPGIVGGAEEGERDRAARKRIEGEAMAPPIEEKGAVAPLSAGPERKVDWLAHRASGWSAGASTLSRKGLRVGDDRGVARRAFPPSGPWGLTYR